MSDDKIHDNKLKKCLLTSIVMNTRTVYVSKVIIRTHRHTDRTDCFIWTTEIIGILPCTSTGIFLLIYICVTVMHFTLVSKCLLLTNGP